MTGDFKLPEDLDPETVLICTSCRAEYSNRFVGTFCIDCEGQLMARDGTLVFPEADELEKAGASAADLVPFEILESFETNNPYLERLFDHELYGQIPQSCLGILSELSSFDPEEKLLGALRVRHGQREAGFLMITTHFLRYVKAGRLFTVLKHDEFWPLSYDIETEGTLGPGVIRTVTGHQFQIWGMKAKKFRDFYHLAQLAFSWQATEAETQRVALHDAAALATVASVAPASGSGSLAAELASLAELRDQGVLSEDEFAAAKRKLLA